MTSMSTMTNEQIEELRATAAAAGDTRMVGLTHIALESTSVRSALQARRACLAAIQDAERVDEVRRYNIHNASIKA